MDKEKKNKIVITYLAIYYIITLISTNIIIVEILNHFNINNLFIDLIIFSITIYSHIFMISGETKFFKK